MGHDNKEMEGIIALISRKSLLQELKSAKEVLISSLRNVHDLEMESRKVPKLEARVHQLEGASGRKR